MATAAPRRNSAAKHTLRIGPDESRLFIDLTRARLELQGDEAQPYSPPWTTPYIIGIAGNLGLGKTTVAQRIIQELNQPWTVLLLLDNFYNPLSPEERQRAFANEFDFDVPELLDLRLLYETVKLIREGRKTQIPVYLFSLHNRTDKHITIYGATVIIIEGIYALYDPELLLLMDTKVYVDTDLDVCLLRRLTRDILHRGRDLEGALKQWLTFVKPAAEKLVKPTMNNADVVLPRGADSSAAINMLIQHVQRQLEVKLRQHVGYLQLLFTSSDAKPLAQDPRLLTLARTPQVQGMDTILMDRKTPRSDFVFYFNRLALMLITRLLDTVECVELEVVTPQGYTAKVMRRTEQVVAVHIIRLGDCFMTALKQLLVEVLVGKLLIQLDLRTGEPQLHTESIPRRIGEPNTRVLLFDAQVVSGAAAVMAIQVLVDHGVDPLRVVVVCYMATEIGVRRVFGAFPQVKLVAGRVSLMGDTAGAATAPRELDTDWCFHTRFIDGLYFGTA